jgi:hypothetical protein
VFTEWPIAKNPRISYVDELPEPSRESICRLLCSNLYNFFSGRDIRFYTFETHRQVTCAVTCSHSRVDLFDRRKFEFGNTTRLEERCNILLIYSNRHKNKRSLPIPIRVHRSHQKMRHLDHHLDDDGLLETIDDRQYSPRIPASL